MKNYISRQWKAGFETYVFLILIAIELLMSFTFLGYIHISPISITTAYIPILITGCLLGPVQTTVVGMVFGLASMFKATAHYVMPVDQIFSPFLSGNPLGSILLSVGARTLFGLITGLLFAFIKKKKHFRIWMGVFCAIGPKLHAGLVYLAMQLFFPEQGYTLRHAGNIAWDDLLLSILCIIIVQIVWSFYNSNVIRNFRFSVEQAHNMPSLHSHMYSSWIWIVLGCLIATIASTIYFAQRMSYMLGQHGIETTTAIDQDFLHLQIQFVGAMLSLCVITGASLIMVYQCLSYRQYLGELDDLTGLMGRKMFFAYCDTLLQSKTDSGSMEGYFIFLDVDHFKSINDSLGHPVGDKILKGVAKTLQHHFSSYGIFGRVGGDEFVAFLYEPLKEADLRQLLDWFLEDIADLYPKYGKISCSIGVSHFVQSPDIQELFNKTDIYLYEAKELGRAQYVIRDFKN